MDARSKKVSELDAVTRCPTPMSSIWYPTASLSNEHSSTEALTEYILGLVAQQDIN